MNFLRCKKILGMGLAIVLFVSLMRLPLSARERRGSTVEVTTTGGSRIRGELLAVANDTLLVFDWDAGQGKHLRLEEVVQVRVRRKSKVWNGVAAGLLVGLALSEYQYGIVGDDEDMAELVYLLLPPRTGLMGGLIGAFAGIDKKILLAGVPPATRRRNVDGLRKYAREKEVPISDTSVMHRVHLLWSPTRQSLSRTSDSYAGNGVFRFVPNGSSKDTAVYPCYPFPYGHEHVRVDRFRLEYEWSPHLSSSLEFAVSGKLDNYIGFDVQYFSIDYGKQYKAHKYILNEYSYASFLLGLNWKPISPSFYRKPVVELGITAGPAQVNLNSRLRWDGNPLQKCKDLTWSVGIHAACEHPLSRNFLCGVFLGYQRLRASFPGLVFVNEEEEFLSEGDDGETADSFIRPTEFDIPAHRIRLDGGIFGFRIGLRF